MASKKRIPKPVDNTKWEKITPEDMPNLKPTKPIEHQHLACVEQFVSQLKSEYAECCECRGHVCKSGTWMVGPLKDKYDGLPMPKIKKWPERAPVTVNDLVWDDRWDDLFNTQRWHSFVLGLILGLLILNLWL